MNEDNEKEVNEEEKENFDNGIKEEKEQMEVKEEVLEKAGREYYESAEDELKKGRYNSSVVLYFKSLATFSDLFLLKNTGNAPSSHNERFRIIQEKFSDVYELLDKDFPFYQDSYTKIMSRELAEVIKDDAETMAEKAEVEL